MNIEFFSLLYQGNFLRWFYLYKKQQQQQQHDFIPKFKLKIFIDQNNILKKINKCGVCFIKIVSISVVFLLKITIVAMQTYP